MPEVCEVRLSAIYLNKKLKNNNITSIKVIKGRYLKKDLPGLKSTIKLLPLKVKKVRSKGKFIWFEFKDKNNNTLYLFSTLGLEGRWSFKKINNSNVQFKIKNKLGKIKTLYYADSRNFGTLKFINSKAELDKKLFSLGPDFLQTNFNNRDFKKRIKNYLTTKAKHDKKIVTVLMEQGAKTGIGSGLGNYLVPEILFRAKISPHTKMGDLFKNTQKINKLAHMIKYVVKLCYLTNKTKYVDHFIKFIEKHYDRIKLGLAENYHNDIDIKKNKFCYLVYRQKKDPKGNDIVGEKIIKGRTTYWSPNIQT